DPSVSLLLHDKLQVPNSSRRAWNEHDSRCDVCATHLTQLKQEAVRMVLTLDQWDLSPPSSPSALIGRYGPPGPMGASGGPGPSHGLSNPSHGSPSVGQTSGCAPTNQQPQGQGHRLGSKPSSLGLGGGGDRRVGSPSLGKSVAQQQPVTGVNSPGHNSGAVLSTAALQAHQHLTRTNGGVTLYPYQLHSSFTAASLLLHCCFTAASLLLHCSLTAASLLLHSSFTAASLLLHCCFTAASLLLHCSFTAASLLLHCSFTAASLLLHCSFTAASLLLHCSFTAASLLLHCSFTAASLLLHSCFTAASLQLHCCFTAASLQLHSSFTAASLQHSRTHQRLLLLVTVGLSESLLMADENILQHIHALQ
ncbi:hypothetical protein KUCAC02_002082, partial [Chaenocephalus aceratus]